MRYHIIDTSQIYIVNNTKPMMTFTNIKEALSLKREMHDISVDIKLSVYDSLTGNMISHEPS